MRARTRIAAALAFAGTVAGPAAHAQRVLLRGQVVDAESGQPIRSAVVEVRPRHQTVVTDEQGRFALRVERGDNALIADALGYASTVAALTLEGDTTDLAVRLARDPVRLPGITATLNRFESRRRAYGYASRTLSADDIAHSSATDAWTLLRTRMGVSVVSCGRGTGRFGPTAGAMACVHVRGTNLPLRVYVDEMRLFDASALAIYSPAELAGAEFYPSHGEMRVYTRRFMEWAATHNYRPVPLAFAQ